jgi:hypothetical protein
MMEEILSEQSSFPTSGSEQQHRSAFHMATVAPVPIKLIQAEPNQVSDPKSIRGSHIGRQEQSRIPIFFFNCSTRVLTEKNTQNNEPDLHFIVHLENKKKLSHTCGREVKLSILISEKMRAQRTAPTRDLPISDHQYSPEKR